MMVDFLYGLSPCLTRACFQPHTLQIPPIDRCENEHVRAILPAVDRPIPYEGKESKNPLAFTYYNKNQRVGEKTMGEHLRFAVAYWHSFMGTGVDMFGGPSFQREWHRSGDPMDLFHAHIGGMDAFARGLLIAHRIREDGPFARFIEERYGSCASGIGSRMMSGKATLQEVEKWVLGADRPVLGSGRQEMLENILNSYIQ